MEIVLTNSYRLHYLDPKSLLSAGFFFDSIDKMPWVIPIHPSVHLLRIREGLCTPAADEVIEMVLRLPCISS